MAYTALLDANVLHPMVLCDLLIRLAQRGLFRARWSRAILEETMHSIARRRPDIPSELLQRRIDRMNLAIQDAEVSGFEDLVESLESMGDDAHVLAAAIVGQADVIVTANLRHFPDEILGQYQVVAQSPDDFLLAQWGLRQDLVVAALLEQASALKHPPMSPEDVLARLGVHAPRFVTVVRSELKGQV